MNSLLEKYKWIKYLLCAFIVGLGVAVIILALVNSGKLPEIINIVLASGFLLIGVSFLIMNLLTETHKPFTVTAIVACVLITIGILLLVTRFHLNISLGTSFIVYMSAILSIVVGAYSLFKAIALIVYREKVVFIIMMFVIATAAITLGILGLCYVPQLIAVSYVMLGIALVVIGFVFLSLFVSR